MMTTTPLEDRLYGRQFDDGLIDVFVGAGLTLLGLAWIMGQIALGALVPAILIPFWRPLHARLIAPRSASARFSPERSGKTRYTLTAWLIVGAGFLVSEIALLAVAPQSGGMRWPPSGDWIVGLPAFLIGLGLLAGLTIGARRVVVYAAMAVFAGTLGAITGVDEPGFLILAIGAAIALSGSVILVAYMRRDPPESDAE